MKFNVGRTYMVSSPNGCSVYNLRYLIYKEIPAGGSRLFVAQESELQLDDSEAVVTEVRDGGSMLLGELLGNTGNGSLPAGFTAVEYLDSTRTQWIDTLYYPCWDSVIDTEGCFLNSAANYALYASVENKVDNWDGAYFFIRYQSVSDGWASHGKQSGRTAIPGLFKNGIKQVFNASKDGIFIDSLKIDNAFEPSVYRNVHSLYLFARNYLGVAELPSEARIWSFKASEKGVTKLNFVPCLDPTGAPCMFDFVSRKPFYNQGTGDFLYPTEHTTYALRRVLPDWGKLTEHGLRRLYHAPANYKGELYDYAMENGYKPIVEPEKPAEGYWAPRWTETADEIVLEWVETEPPIDETLTNN